MENINMNMNMNIKELLSKLGQEVIISYMSDVKLTGGKKNEQQGRITKVTENLLVTLTSDAGEYKVRMKESVDPNFELKPRKWGVRNADGLIEHNDELYVEFLVEGRGKTRYFLDDHPILKDEIIGLPSIPENDTGIVLRCVKLTNILSVE